MRFNGVQIVVDQYAPAQKIWGLNTKYVQFWISTVPKYQFGSKAPLATDSADDFAVAA